MTYAETRIIYDDDTAFEPEDPVVYGAKVAELVIRRGWISPNNAYGVHWAKTFAFRKEIAAQVQAHVLQLSPDERDIACLKEPRPRLLRIHVHQRRGRFPDADNLIAGLKHLIDALKRIQYRPGLQSKKKQRGHSVKIGSPIRVEERGPGLIWDDAPKYLRIAEVIYNRDPLPVARDDKTTYCTVEVFEWPDP